MRVQPRAEFFHERGNLGGVRKYDWRSRDPSRELAVNSGNRRLAAGNDAPVQFAHGAFANRLRPRGELAHSLHGFIMIDGFEMVTKRFAPNRNAVLDDLRRLTQREGVSLDSVGRVGQFNVVVLLQLRQGSHGERAHAVEPRFLLFDTVDKGRKHRRYVAHL